MAADSPDRFVATVTKAKRKGKILVDYLRNGRGATAVAPFSTRSRPGAPVSMPIGWDELGGEIGPAYFTVANALTRLAHQQERKVTSSKPSQSCAHLMRTLGCKKKE